MQYCVNVNDDDNFNKDVIPTYKSNIDICSHQILNCYPVARWKHATVIYDNYLYLMGGYSWTNTLKDLWRLNLSELNKIMTNQFKSIGLWSSIGNLGNNVNFWEDLSKFDGKISPLQSHTMVAYKNHLYIFGGAFTYDVRNCPFWIYDIGNKVMQKWKPLDVNVPIPFPRRNHSCCIFRSAMVLFGGFGDVRGSLGDLWAFDFESDSSRLSFREKEENTSFTGISQDTLSLREGGNLTIETIKNCWDIFNHPNYSLFTRPSDHNISRLMKHSISDTSLLETRKWLLIWCTQQYMVNKQIKRSIVKYGPSARHDHRAVVHKNHLIIFGGMCGLEICNDLWQWNFNEYQWTKLIYKGDLSDLAYITDVKINNHWLLFGINDARRKSEKWIYSFSQNKWTTSAYYIPEFHPFSTLSWFSNSDNTDIFCDKVPQNKSKLNKIHPIFIDSFENDTFESINLQSCCIQNTAVNVRSFENYRRLDSVESLSKETISTDLTDNGLCETTFIHSTNGEELPNKPCDKELLIILGNNIDRASFEYHLNIQMLYV